MAARARKATLIPAVMREADRWVSWKPVKRGERWTKMPVRVDGRAASTRDPGTWAAFADVAHLERRGWVLGNGIGCIDLDDCITLDGLADWAQAVLDEVADRALLVEVSPSGRGVHIFLPMEPGKGTVIRDGRNIEVYPPDSGRYICVTGKVLDLTA